MQIDPTQLERADVYRLMISSIAPRPIAWVSTLSPDGIANAAPFSYFCALGSRPPSLLIAAGNRRPSEQPKDTVANIRATGEFVVNIVSEASAERMVHTAVDFPPETSEFDEVGLEQAPSTKVKPPRIAECLVSLECELDQILQIAGSNICVGRVVLFHVADGLLGDDYTISPDKLRPLGRMGGRAYAPLREILEFDNDRNETRRAVE